MNALTKIKTPEVIFQNPPVLIEYSVLNETDAL